MFASKKQLASASRLKTRRTGLQMELLENRQLMTVGMSVDGSGLLSIRGDNTMDIVTVYKQGLSTMVQYTNSAGVTNVADMGIIVNRLDVRMNGGNDTFNNGTDMQADIRGGSGDDTLNGGSGRDYLYGDAGNDTLNGNGSSDVMYGGNDNDTMYGNAGTDYMYGSLGNDVMTGGGGSDYLYGNTGNDTLYGDDFFGATVVDGEAAGNDKLSGGDGHDTILGSAYDDVLWGGNGNDSLYGQDGNDRLFGNVGLDTLFGMNGDDFLDPGSTAAADNYVGGDGNDFHAYTTVVNGATSNDIAQGNSNNCFILAAMSEAAEHGVNMASRITYTGNSNYNVSLFSRDAAGNYTPTTVSVMFEGVLRSTDPTAHYRGQEGESWNIIMNRALAQLLNVNLDTTTGGYAGDVLGAILGRAPSTVQWVDNTGYVSPFTRDGLLDYLFAVGNSVPTVVGTRNTPGEMATTLLAANHVYMVKSVIITGYIYSPQTFQYIPQYSVVLANPWGTDTSTDRINNGTGRPSGDNADGVIVLTGAEFKRNCDEITFA